MANPLKIRRSGATFQGLQVMTNDEMDYAVDVILKNFASTNTGLGTVNIDGATGTSIGAFVDTTRPYTVGQHPVGTEINSVTYTFKQDITSSASESLTRPMEYSSSGIRQQNDTQLNDSIISRALNTLVAGGVGSYALQPASPAGTWTSIGTITNTTSAGTNTSTLWRRTNATAPTTVRPLKYASGVREMTDAEIQSLTNRMRNRIIATGIGTYRLQATAPTPGTWVTVGAAFEDNRNQLANQSYSGTYSGTYTGFYTGNFTGSYSGTYSQAFAGAYTRFRSQAFAGTYVLFYSGVIYGYFTGFYTGFFTGFYTGFYTGNFTGFYAGTYSSPFTGNYTGNYTGFYTGATIQATLETVSNVSLWVRTA